MLTDEQKFELIEIARQSRLWAYAPYSNYRVGAALLSASGRIYEGVNVENAAYPTTMCAERVAVFKAVSQGEQEFVAIAVVTANGGAPCGACRQVMAEFGSDLLVIIADENGKIHQEAVVYTLLPGAFTANQLDTH